MFNSPVGYLVVLLFFNWFQLNSIARSADNHSQIAMDHILEWQEWTKNVRSLGYVSSGYESGFPWGEGKLNFHIGMIDDSSCHHSFQWISNSKDIESHNGLVSNRNYVTIKNPKYEAIIDISSKKIDRMSKPKGTDFNLLRHVYDIPLQNITKKDIASLVSEDGSTSITFKIPSENQFGFVGIYNKQKIVSFTVTFSDSKPGIPTLLQRTFDQVGYISVLETSFHNWETQGGVKIPRTVRHRIAGDHITTELAPWEVVFEQFELIDKKGIQLETTKTFLKGNGFAEPGEGSSPVFTYSLMILFFTSLITLGVFIKRM